LKERPSSSEKFLSCQRSRVSRKKGIHVARGLGGKKGSREPKGVCPEKKRKTALTGGGRTSGLSIQRGRRRGTSWPKGFIFICATKKGLAEKKYATEASRAQGKSLRTRADETQKDLFRGIRKTKKESRPETFLRNQRVLSAQS